MRDLTDTTTEELFMVVNRTFSGQPPKLHKTLSDKFYLTAIEAWEVASRENEAVGADFWDVACFSGKLIAELESKEDAVEWYNLN